MNILSFSGPKALVFLQLLISLVTGSVVNITADISDFRLIYLDTSSRGVFAKHLFFIIFFFKKIYYISNKSAKKIVIIIIIIYLQLI